MHFHDIRILLRISYGSGLLLIAYFWIVPESVRWLLATGRIDEAVKVLKRLASASGKSLSKGSIESIHSKYSTVENTGNQDNVENITVCNTFLIIIKSKKLLFRLLIGCYQWIVCCYCYYGLSITSIHIGSDRYMSFILVSLTEIPGALAPFLLLKWMYRKTLLCITLLATGIIVITTPWIPKQYSEIVLAMYMIAKGLITCGFSIIYVYTVEQWPTNSRGTLLSFCSSVGRVGLGKFQIDFSFFILTSNHFDFFLVFAPVTPLLV